MLCGLHPQTITGVLSISEKKNFNHVILWNTLIDSKKETGPSTAPKLRLQESAKNKDFAFEVMVCTHGLVSYYVSVLIEASVLGAALV